MGGGARACALKNSMTSLVSSVSSARRGACPRRVWRGPGRSARQFEQLVPTHPSWLYYNVCIIVLGSLYYTIFIVPDDRSHRCNWIWSAKWEQRGSSDRSNTKFHREDRLPVAAGARFPVRSPADGLSHFFFTLETFSTPIHISKKRSIFLDNRYQLANQTNLKIGNRTFFILYFHG